MSLQKGDPLPGARSVRGRTTLSGGGLKKTEKTSTLHDSCIVTHTFRFQVFISLYLETSHYSNNISKR